MFLRGRPSGAELESLLAEQASLDLTYDEIGATRSALPEGYRHDEHKIVLGTGDLVFERAVLGLRRWEAHRGAGLSVRPDHPELVTGTVVIVALRLPLVTAVATCRIVYVVDEPDAFGFAYGTLPAHPEQGEESFIVRCDAGGVVHFAIRAFSRPRHPLARLGGPVARGVQVATTRRYLRALREFAGRQ